MILRLVSGSVDARRGGRGSAPRRRRRSAGRWNWSRNAATTCSASFLRIRPWSTNTQVSWSPIARWTSSAATAESTPPERPQIARAVADLLADRARPAPRSTEAGDQSRAQPHDVAEEARRGSRCRTACGRPRGGTGCRRARARRPRARRPASRCEDASAVNPGGGSKTVSRWLIQQLCSAGRPAEQPSRRHRGARVASAPNSPTSAPSTRPPSSSDHRLHPVTDAEHRDAELEQLGAQLRRPLGVDRRRAAGEDQPARAALRDLLERDVVRQQLARRRRTRGRAARSAASTGRRSRGPGPPRSPGLTPLRDLRGASARRRARSARHVDPAGVIRVAAAAQSSRRRPPARPCAPFDAHADRLLALELLALGLERRGDHHLGPVELGMSS